LSPVNNKKSDFGYQNAQFFEKFFDSAVRADNLHFEKRMLKYYQSQKGEFHSHFRSERKWQNWSPDSCFYDTLQYRNSFLKTRF